jgi:RNA polymerase sigma factor (sigma-70 family)
VEAAKTTNSTTLAGAGRIARVRAAQRGDVGAFALLVDEHEAALRRFCQHLLSDGAPAEDLAQETLLRAFQALPRLEDPARFGAWLFGIAANLARLTWRRRHRAPLSLDQLGGSAEPPGRSAGAAGWLSPAPTTPELAYEQAEQARRLMDAIESLPPQLRHTVILHYVEDLSYAEVAAAMRVPVTTVTGWLHKSRTRLWRALACGTGDGIAGAVGSAEPPRLSPSRSRPRQPDSPQRQSHALDRKEMHAMSSTRVTGTGPSNGGSGGSGGASATAWWEGIGTVSPTLFSERAIYAFRAAEAEARGWQHNYIGTEHLLLGVLYDPDGLPAQVLGGLGAPPDAVRSALEYRVGRGEMPSRPQLGVVARARIALELAREDMRFLKHEQIAPEHVLLGLIQVPQGIAALILESMGLSLAQVRATLLAAVPLDEGSPRFYWHKASAASAPTNG